MRDRLIGGMVLAAVLAFSSLAMAQAGLDNNMYKQVEGKRSRRAGSQARFHRLLGRALSRAKG